MSRLEEECIMAVVRNRSGIDSGEIDYQLRHAKFERASAGCVRDMIFMLRALIEKCEERLDYLNNKDKNEIQN